ncbi:MAG: adenylate/guanylate cyclase domain-containing protein [Aquihabitans sp.]
MTGSTPCAICGASLPAGARFCPDCGNPTGSDPSLEERRIVTVVFADIEGFTALAEHRDPESVKELLDACFGALIPVIDDHGGRVDKVIGDELMAVFGAPSTYEDDPERAVRAALALGPALEAVQPGLRLRVGVNTGEVLAGVVGPAQSYTVTGDVVNTAHRLVTAAEPGEVLVGDRTRQATYRAIDFRLRGDLDLKGKQDLVRAWVARGDAVDPPDQAAATSELRIVGRDRDVAELNRSLTRPMVESAAAMVTVVGEPGVGLTRLGAEVAARLSAQPMSARVLWVTCPSYGTGSDLGPLADLARAALGITSTQPRPMQAQALTDRVEELAHTVGTDATTLRGRLAALLGLDPAQPRTLGADAGPSRRRVTNQQFGALRTVLAALAHERPVLVVVDDLHAAGADLVRFLLQVPDLLDDCPVAVLALGRDEVLVQNPELVAGGPRRSTRTLGPLDPDATEDLAVALLRLHAATEAAPRIGPAALERLIVSSGGNPLVLDQLVRYLVESGSLHELDGLWLLDTDHADGTGIPDGVRSLIGARLDCLPPEERALLMMAAVFGGRFWRDALRDLSGVDEVDGLLARLDSRGFTAPVRDDGRGDHIFRHALTSDVAYASLPIGERASRHARVAAWLDVRFGTKDEPAPLALLAHHYERAVVLARAVDHTDPGLGGAAFSALLRAARSEHRREGLRQADHWYRRARDLGTNDTLATLAVIAEHGEVLLELRQLDAARVAFEDVLRRSEAAHPEAAASALAHLGAVARLSGDTEAAREGFNLAAGRWRDLGDIQGQIDTLRLEGWCEITAGRFRAALPRLERALALEFSIDSQERRGETLRYLGWCEYLAGNVAQARVYLWEAIGRSAETVDPGALAWCFGLLASTLLHGGQAARSLEMTENLRAVALRNGDPWGEWTCVSLSAAAHLSLGDTEVAATLIAEAESHLAELDDVWGLSIARVVRAQAARIGGDLVLARAVLSEALSSSRDLAYVGEDARLIVELARVELDARELDEAERHARSGLALVRAGIGDHESGLRSLYVLAEIEDRRGHADAAELLLEEAVTERDPDDRTDAWRQAAIALAERRLHAGDVTRARHLAAQCIEAPTDEVRILADLEALVSKIPPPE